MLKHGFRGVAEIENHVANTFGWSATADAVEPWIYTEISKTFVLDPIMFNRLWEMNPHSARSLTSRLLEAHTRGYWNPDEEIVERLRDIVGQPQESAGKRCMKVTVFYVGSSLLAPLKQAEREINRQYDLDLNIAAYNFGAPMSDDGWLEIDRDLQASEVVFAIHVMDGENAGRLITALDRSQTTPCRRDRDQLHAGSHAPNAHGPVGCVATSGRDRAKSGKREGERERRTTR